MYRESALRLIHWVVPCLFVCVACGHESEDDSAALQDQPNPLILDIKDTVCIAYHFEPGDSLIYFVESSDSIATEGSPPLLKKRRETFAILCDSSTTDGRFHLRQTLIAFESIESQGEVRNVTRKESDWVNRQVVLMIDSLGQRIHSYARRQVPGVTPGGVFQPLLLPPLGESCKGLEESWMVEHHTDSLSENAVPVPLRRRTTLYRMLPRIDTLNAQNLQFQYNLSGQGSATTSEQHQPLLVKSVIAEFGRVRFSADHKVPMHIFATSELKLTVQDPSGHFAHARHYISTNSSLIRLHRKGRQIL